MDGITSPLSPTLAEEWTNLIFENGSVSVVEAVAKDAQAEANDADVSNYPVFKKHTMALLEGGSTSVEDADSEDSSVSSPKESEKNFFNPMNIAIIGAVAIVAILCVKQGNMGMIRGAVQPSFCKIAKLFGGLFR